MLSSTITPLIAAVGKRPTPCHAPAVRHASAVLADDLDGAVLGAWLQQRGGGLQCEPIREALILCARRGGGLAGCNGGIVGLQSTRTGLSSVNLLLSGRWYS